MKTEKPILFQSEMVRAILRGDKTQTRRVVKSPFPKVWKEPVNLAEHGSGDYSGDFNDPMSWGYPFAEDGADMPLGMWHDNFGNVRVMTVCEGYVMARRPRAMPFTKSMADFKNTFKEGKKP